MADCETKEIHVVSVAGLEAYYQSDEGKRA
jgi:hypothetical protein